MENPEQGMASCYGSMESSPDIVIVTKSDLTVQMVNKTFLTYYDIPDNLPVIGLFLEEVIKDKQFYGTLLNFLNESFKGEKNIYEANAVFPKKGSLEVEVTCYPVYDKKGIISSAVISVRDITKRKQLFEFLKRAEDQHLMLLELFPDIIYKLDADGRFVYINSAVRILGYDSLELIGQHFSVIIHPDDIKRVSRNEVLPKLKGIKTGSENAPKLFDERRTGSRMIRNLEIRLIPKEIDGKREPDTSLFGSVFAVGDVVASGHYEETEDGENGRFLGTIGVVRDITDRKNMENELRSNKQRYQVLINNFPDIIIQFDNQFQVEYAKNDNKHNVFSSTLDIKGKRLEELELPGSLAEVCEEKIKHVFLTGQTVEKRVDFDRGNRPNMLNCSWIPERSQEGKIESVLCIIRDITEIMTIEAQLRQAQKMEAIGTLAGGIAHDFNNQLTGILGFAELLKKNQVDEKNISYTDRIINASQRAKELIAQLLAFARWGKHQAAPVDIHDVIFDVISILERSIDKRIQIRQELDSMTLKTTGDISQIQSAILNIAINARDAMPDGGELLFSTKLVEVGINQCPKDFPEAKPGKYIAVRISDTGMGIDKDVKKRIFEPFFTTKIASQGTGMGLAAVYGTIRGHRGAVMVDSEINKGTKFTILLPYLDTAEAVVIQQIMDTEIPVADTDMHILVVDDEEIVRELIAEMLEELGYRVTACAGGVEAVEYYNESWEDVDLVILDMMMPELNGRDTFSALKKINPAIKALLSSGFSEKGEAEEILDEGVIAFVQKPFEMQELIEKISEALEVDLLK